MPTTVMLVTCALKRRNGTCTKRNIFDGARSTTFEMPLLHLFTNWNIFCISVKKTAFSRFVGSRNALLLQSLLFQNVLSHNYVSLSFPLTYVIFGFLVMLPRQGFVS